MHSLTSRCKIILETSLSIKLIAMVRVTFLKSTFQKNKCNYYWDTNSANIKADRVPKIHCRALNSISREV